MTKGKRIGMIAGIVAVLALIIVFVIWFTGPGALTPKATTRSYIKSIIDQDVDDYTDVCFPRKLQKEIDFKSEVERVMPLFPYAKASDVRKIKIVDKKTADKDVIKMQEDMIKDYYNIEMKTSKMVYVKYECEIKVDGEWKKDSGAFWLYKTEGKWFRL
ncbi:MAG: hypothetical protein NC240_04270 [Clostridium sp.]|nr:hypothetical protein [Clostridium sp.]